MQILRGIAAATVVGVMLGASLGTAGGADQKQSRHFHPHRTTIPYGQSQVRIVFTRNHRVYIMTLGGTPQLLQPPSHHGFGFSVQAPDSEIWSAEYRFYSWSADGKYLEYIPKPNSYSSKTYILHPNGQPASHFATLADDSDEPQPLMWAMGKHAMAFETYSQASDKAPVRTHVLGVSLTGRTRPIWPHKRGYDNVCCGGWFISGSYDPAWTRWFVELPVSNETVQWLTSEGILVLNDAANYGPARLSTYTPTGDSSCPTRSGSRSSCQEPASLPGCVDIRILQAPSLSGITALPSIPC